MYWRKRKKGKNFKLLFYKQLQQLRRWTMSRLFASRFVRFSAMIIVLSRRRRRQVHLNSRIPLGFSLFLFFFTIPVLPADRRAYDGNIIWSKGSHGGTLWSHFLSILFSPSSDEIFLDLWQTDWRWTWIINNQLFCCLALPCIDSETRILFRLCAPRQKNTKRLEFSWLWISGWSRVEEPFRALTRRRGRGLKRKRKQNNQQSEWLGRRKDAF